MLLSYLCVCCTCTTSAECATPAVFLCCAKDCSGPLWALPRTRMPLLCSHAECLVSLCVRRGPSVYHNRMEGTLIVCVLVRKECCNVCVLISAVCSASPLYSNTKPVRVTEKNTQQAACSYSRRGIPTHREALLAKPETTALRVQEHDSHIRCDHEVNGERLSQRVRDSLNRHVSIQSAYSHLSPESVCRHAGTGTLGLSMHGHASRAVSKD